MANKKIENKYLEKLYELRKQRKAEGLCANCGKSLDREGYYCEDCNKKYNEYKFDIVHKNHLDNKCSNCSKTLDREGWFCIECAKKLRFHAAERSAFRRANSLCVQCGQPTDIGSYCQRCRDMRMEMYWRKKRSTKGIK